MDLGDLKSQHCLWSVGFITLGQEGKRRWEACEGNTWHTHRPLMSWLLHLFMLQSECLHRSLSDQTVVLWLSVLFGAEKELCVHVSTEALKWGDVFRCCNPVTINPCGQQLVVIVTMWSKRQLQHAPYYKPALRASIRRADSSANVDTCQEIIGSAAGGWATVGAVISLSLNMFPFKCSVNPDLGCNTCTERWPQLSWKAPGGGGRLTGLLPSQRWQSQSCGRHDGWLY